MSESRLRDRRILVVEDEYFIAMDMEQELIDAGAHVVGPASSVEAALALVSGSLPLDGAVLDVNLGGHKVFPVADALAVRGVPFLFATGYGQSDIPPRYSHVRRCEKPVEASVILAAIGQEVSGNGER